MNCILNYNWYLCGELITVLRLMNNSEFEAIKAELARNILNSSDRELIESMRRCYENSVECTLPPCCYSIDEVKVRLRNTESDALAGRGLTTEEVVAATEKWL